MGAIKEAFIEAGFMPEKQKSDIVGRIFISAMTRSHELRAMFSEYPQNEARLERILREYRIFSDGYNAGNIAATGFKVPGDNEVLPSDFIELASILVAPKKVKTPRHAWNFIHTYLSDSEVPGIYEEKEIEPTIANILQLTHGTVQKLLSDGGLSQEVLEVVNKELSSVYKSLGGDLRGLKQDSSEKFHQLVERIEGKCKKKGYEYDEGKVLRHVRAIFSILDRKK